MKKLSNLQFGMLKKKTFLQDCMEMEGKKQSLYSKFGVPSLSSLLTIEGS